MSVKKILGTGLVVSAALLLYGGLVEVDKLTVERRRLRLRRWPRALDGFRVGFLADFHLMDNGTEALAHRAIAALLDAEPDVILLGGDLVNRWTDDSADRIRRVLGPLHPQAHRCFAVPGNREYLGGSPEDLEPILEDLGIQLLRNEVVEFEDILIAGIDSANAGQADPLGTLEQADLERPTLVLWHEPDMVDWLIEGADLMLSGHSHGGQFTTPWGWAPVTSKNGRKYRRGFYHDAPTPLYVTRGLGTTGPPARLFCRPEVSILDLYGPR